VLSRTKETARACVEVSTSLAREGEKHDGDISLGPNEGLVLRLS
jgi:hypothetical protein